MEKVIKSPRVCFGMTLYNKAKYLPEALESLLRQTHADFTLVAVDDCSTDETETIMRAWSEKDKRLHYFRNHSWQGMINTWRNAFFKCLELCRPDFFAWVSDHDVWHPDWLKRHIDTMLASPDAALVYPETIAIGPAGEHLPIPPEKSFDTYDEDVMRHLYQVSSQFASAGYAVYGLFRVEHLLKAGVFRRVLCPDRLLITEISAYGRIRQIPEKLWSRRFLNPDLTEEETFNRQKGVLFGPDGPPPQAAFPFLSHVLSILFNVCILPQNGDRSNFFRGLAIAGLVWERRRRRIRKELDLLNSGIQNKKAFGNQFDGIRDNDDERLTNELKEILKGDAFLITRSISKELFDRKGMIGLTAATLTMNSGFIETALLRLGLSETEQTINQLQREREEIKKENKSLGKELTEAKIRKADLKAKLTDLKARIAQSEAMISDLKARSETRISDLKARKKVEFDELSEKLSKAKQEKEFWKREARLSLGQKIARKLRISEKPPEGQV